MSKVLFLANLSFLIYAGVLQFSKPDKETDFHNRTQWILKPSAGLDALCLFNVLSADPFYLPYYQAEFDHYNPLFTPEERTSFQKLKVQIKDKAKGIVSADLALYLSALPTDTLEQLIETVHKNQLLRASLIKTPYWDEEHWALYERIQPDLQTALSALKRVGFPMYWQKKTLPKVEKRISELNTEISKYNIVPVIESMLGKRFNSDRITVYLAAYSEPHGIRITGTRFITSFRYPLEILLHNSVHEMMHPPYEAAEPAVSKAIEKLGKDPLIQDKVEHHNQAFGYNSTAEYIEEDSVQALEAVISEQFGFGRDQKKYWAAQDDGMHVLAIAIYLRYKQWLSAPHKPLSYGEWMVNEVNEGNLEGPQLSIAIKSFLSSR